MLGRLFHEDIPELFEKILHKVYVKLVLFVFDMVVLEEQLEIDLIR